MACCELSSGALSEAVKKLPELEELHIFIPVPSRCISSGDIETIGKSCPMLKSFTYNQPRCNHPSPEYYSEEEEEVSKTDYNAYLPKIEEKPEAASSNHDHLHHDCEVKEEQKEDEIEDEREKEKEDEKEEEREEETKKEKDEVIEEEKEEEREEEKEKENEEEIEEEKEEEMEEEKEEEPEADYNNYSPKLEEKPEAAYNNHDHLHHVYVEDDNEAEDDDDDDDDDEEQEDVEMEGYHEFYENSEFVGSVPYDSDDDNRYDINNEDAKAIARTMPNLQHLGLVANDLTEKGLKAILEGCPRLESLDLRMCYGVYLQGKVWRRCCEQIKDVKLPCDSIDEHPYAWKHRRRSPYMKRSEWFEYISTL